jgi:hypothetical protein
MAANDYHVIMYQILLYLYDCLKKGIDPDNEAVEAYRKLRQINMRYWSRVIIDMQNDGYIEKATVFAITNVGWQGARITRDTAVTRNGIEYLIDNSLMQKIKELGTDAIKGMISGLGSAVLN